MSDRSKGLPEAELAEVLSFWFGDPPSSANIARWFKKDRSFDDTIRERLRCIDRRSCAGPMG